MLVGHKRKINHSFGLGKGYHTKQVYYKIYKMRKRFSILTTLGDRIILRRSICISPVQKFLKKTNGHQEDISMQYIPPYTQLLYSKTGVYLFFLFLPQNIDCGSLYGCMCDEIVVYAIACVLRNKMACAMKLDYSEEEVRKFNLTFSPSSSCARHRSRRLELGLDAVADHNIFSALSRSACLTCCCIAL